MRVNNFSPMNLNCNRRKNINFGKFLDNNARNVVRKALTIEDDPGFAEIMQPCYDGFFKQIDECEYINIFTDKNGIVQGEFDDEFKKSNEGNRKIALAIELTEDITLDDQEGLGKDYNCKSLAHDIRGIDDILTGKDTSKKYFSDNDSSGSEENYALMRAEEEAYR